MAKPVRNILFIMCDQLRWDYLSPPFQKIRTCYAVMMAELRARKLAKRR